MSFANSFANEVEAGGTTYRLQTFVVQSMALMNAFAPLYVIYSMIPVNLNLIFYSGVLLLAGLNRIAYLCHKNQIARNAEKFDDIVSFPLGLDESSFFIKLIYFLSNHASRAFYGLYLVGLGIAFYYEATVMVAASLAMLSINYLYKHGWFPSWLESSYLFFTSFLLIGATFGIDSIVGITLSTINIVFMLYDYVQTHIRGMHSATSQFPIATKEHLITVNKDPDLSPEIRLEQVNNLINRFKYKRIRPTFNHFKQSSELTEKLLGYSPKLTPQELQEFATQFTQLNFNKPDLRDLILNEMVSHDRFNQLTEHEHMSQLGLIPDNDRDNNNAESNVAAFNIDPVDVRIAYLKQEINLMITRLSVYDYKGLPADRMAALYGHARSLLNYLKTTANEQEKEIILISLALRTGSQCTRAYLDEFTNLNHQYGLLSNHLTLHERAIMNAQDFRTARFNDYYFHFMSVVIKNHPVTIFKSMFDSTDYHNFESFALALGGYFYLRNTSLSIRIRNLLDIVVEKYNYHMLRSVGQLLFADYYNETSLVNEILNPSGCFGSLLFDWCATIHPELYAMIFLDNDSMPRIGNHPEIHTLAKLLLVDLGIAEYTDPCNLTINNNEVISQFAESPAHHQTTTSPRRQSILFFQEPIPINLEQEELPDLESSARANMQQL
ncbi:MAG: hypothetical protein ACOVQX_04075 [Legionella sp.]